MRVIVDLHIHSRFSRATSKRLEPPLLERWACIKGVQLLGSGDCTHPLWLAELREQLDDAEEGFFTLKPAVRKTFDRNIALSESIPLPDVSKRESPVLRPRFVLSGEISTIYKKDNKTRKVHHLVILSGFAQAAVFQAKLERVGNIRSDGRPILGLDSRDLLALLLDADPRAILVPAHIWTPWFSALGAKSGFDSIDECYADLAGQINAIETGLSSNPPMNWALSGLDRFSVISNSDAHSADKLAREATIFEMDMNFSSFSAALRINGKEETYPAQQENSAPQSGLSVPVPRISATIEFFPQEGKYHYDGHRKCGIFLSPKESSAAEQRCPVCGKPLTRGVIGRVLELADRPVDESAPCPVTKAAFTTNQRPYYSLIPLIELVSELLKTGPSSKKALSVYNRLIESAGCELAILMDMPLSAIEQFRLSYLSGELLAQAIDRMRHGNVSISPGYDGEYGVIRTFAPGELSLAAGEAEFFERPPSCNLLRNVPDNIPRVQEEVTKKPIEKTGLPVNLAHGVEASSPSASFVPDAEQERIIADNSRYALIIAGPGAGKTAVITARIFRLINDGVDPAGILALSFTVKAALELRERISATLHAADNASVITGTFHSLSASILREQEGKYGIPLNFKIISESERETLLQEILNEREGKTGRMSVRALGTYIENRKRFLLLPNEDRPKIAASSPDIQALLCCAENFFTGASQEPAEQLYARYRAQLHEISALDFDDLVSGTVRLLAAFPEIRIRCQQRFRFIFVDEYQDINFAQYALIRLLAPSSVQTDIRPAQNDLTTPSLWCIGDPNQAIYGFRGSDKRFMDRFSQDYPGAASFTLSRCFRCAAPIISAAGRLIGTDLQGRESQVYLFRSEYPNEKSESESIARTIAHLSGGTSFFAFDSSLIDNTDDSRPAAAEDSSLGACAILLRVLSLAPPITKALRDHGIPYILSGERPWWEEEPIITLRARLRESLETKNAFASELIPLRQAVLSAWERLKKQKKIKIPRGKAGLENNAEALVERLSAMAALFNDLPSFLDTLSSADTQSADNSPESPEIKRDGVRIMSIHASKGLEFDHVFVPAIEDGLLPFTLYDKKNKPCHDDEKTRAEHIEEEKRLLYVAMTRSRCGLYLSWAKKRLFQGRELENHKSRFLDSLQDLIPLKNDYRKKARDPQLRLF